MYCIINPSAGQVKYSLAADKYANEKYARPLFRVNDRGWLNSESKVRKIGTTVDKMQDCASGSVQQIKAGDRA